MSSLVSKRVLVDLPAGVPLPEHEVTDHQLHGGSRALIMITHGRVVMPSALKIMPIHLTKKIGLGMLRGMTSTVPTPSASGGVLSKRGGRDGA